MRTNIDIDDTIMQRAMELSRLKTKKEVVDKALQEFVQNRSRLDLRDLFGKIEFAEGYDYKKARGTDL
jgi:Arc/MetJ family transcription regulator